MIQRIMLLLFLWTWSFSAWAADHVYISILMDDLGYRPYYDKEVVQLPGAITCAIIPHSFYSLQIAHLAHAAGKEIIAHVPMQAIRGEYLGPGGLTIHESQRQFERLLLTDLLAIPYVDGLNNHMGSLVTQHPQQMQWLMQTIQPTGLFFIDSRTTRHTVAENMAELNDVPTLRRNVFLDDIATQTAIAHQFQQLITIAHQQGMAVAIGHPYPATIAYLQQEIPRLAQQGVTLVSVSQLVSAHEAMMRLEGKIIPGENLTCINPSSCLE